MGAFGADAVDDRPFGGAIDLGDEVTRPRLLRDLESMLQAFAVDLRRALGEGDGERADRLEVRRTIAAQGPTTLPKRTDRAGTRVSSSSFLRTM